jgi:hypothetical protein
MSEDKPVACSLGAGELQQRLAAMAEVGAESLISREDEGSHHRLGFRSDATTRRRLEDIVAAESRCCAFLEISLTEEDGSLILSIAAPDQGRAVADALAAAFAG